MTKSLFFHISIIFSGCLFLLPPVQASSLNDFFAHTRNFSAHFSQSQFDADKKLIQRSHGNIQVERPDKFRLQYMKPYAQLYIADGKKLWSYDEDLEQIVVKPQTDALQNSPAMVLSSLKLLRDNYQVSHQGKKQGVDWYRLKPKQNDAGFEAVFLAFKNNKLTKMELLDSFGQTTRLEFSDMKVNIPLTDKTFKFTPPKGVDIIGQK